jgi:hypothetical protein
MNLKHSNNQIIRAAAKLAELVIKDSTKELDQKEREEMVLQAEYIEFDTRSYEKKANT